MKLPSIVYILSEAGRAAVRFPLAIISAIVAAVCAIAAIDGTDNEELLVRMLMVSQMGLPLFIALTLLAERLAENGRRPGVWLVSQIIGLAALAAYYPTIPSEMGTAVITRFIQLNIGLHLLVAFVPYLGQAETNGFWQFNKTLFLRLVAGGIFSATLFAGLSLAILALNMLFGLTIAEEIYARLWMLIVFVFFSWYVLAGIPSDPGGLATVNDYPQVIKVFAQYILAPLVAIYLSILLAYLFKVVVTTQWPSGWIGYLVSSVAAAGLFSLVLLHPVVERAEDRWVNTYARFFNVLLLPAIVMLLLAIYKRVDQYGITENRYFLAVLAFWLAFIALHGIFAKKRTIKVIPMTLCLVAFLSSFGPWGAYSVARSSQTHRLTELLQASELLVEGTLVPAPHEVTHEDRREISAVFDYLIDRHGVEAVSNMFDDSLATKVAELVESSAGHRRVNVEVTRAILDHLGLEYVEKWQREDKTKVRFYQFTRETADEAIDIAGYDVAHSFKIPRDEGQCFEIEGVVYSIDRPDREEILTVLASEEAVLEIDLTPVLEGLRGYAVSHRSHGTAPGDLMTTAASSEALRAKLLVFEIYWRVDDYGLQLQSMEAIILLSTSL